MTRTRIAVAVLCGILFPLGALQGADPGSLKATTTTSDATAKATATDASAPTAGTPAAAPAATQVQPTASVTPVATQTKSTDTTATAKAETHGDSAESKTSGASGGTTTNTTNIQNNNITLGQPSVITVAPANQALPAPAPAPAVAYKGPGDDASSVLGTHAKDEPKTDSSSKVAITPMFGTSGYTGGWYSHVSNTYSFGLGVEIPLTELFAIEAEGGTGRYNVSYGPPSSVPQPAFAHYFNQYNLGGNLKLYLLKHGIRPYVGAGMMALYYENMNTGFGPNGMYGPQTSYNQWMGAGQLIGGMDIPLGGGVAIGGRGAWILPMFNRPYTQDNGVMSAPGYEEAGLMNTSMYKLMGTVSVAF